MMRITPRREVDLITIGIRWKRTSVDVSVHVRPIVRARHLAMAAARGLTLDEHLSASLREERLEDALDFIANPFFAGFTKVEFAQELLDYAMHRPPNAPWGDDPRDMSEEQLRELVTAWAGESEGDARALHEALTAALAEDGAGVRAAVLPLVEAARLELGEKSDEGGAKR